MSILKKAIKPENLAKNRLSKLGDDDPQLLVRYEALKLRVTDRQKDFKALMIWIEAYTAWLTAPASKKNHLDKPHELLEHSVNVAETLLMLRDTLVPGDMLSMNTGEGEIPDESCVIVGLLHDLGKAGVKGKPQYLVNEPSEKQKEAGYPASVPYKFNNDLVYLSVPVRSLYLILPRLSLTEEETQAIVYHEGQYVDGNRGVATKEERLTLLLQYADNWSRFVKERE